MTAAEGLEQTLALLNRKVVGPTTFEGQKIFA